MTTGKKFSLNLQNKNLKQNSLKNLYELIQIKL